MTGVQTCALPISPRRRSPIVRVTHSGGGSSNIGRNQFGGWSPRGGVSPISVPAPKTPKVLEPRVPKKRIFNEVSAIGSGVKNLFGKVERSIKRGYNEGYLNPLDVKRFGNVLATPKPRGINQRYQPAHIGLSNPSSFNYPVRKPAPSIKQSIRKAFALEQNMGVPRGYKTISQRAVSGNPLKEVGTFLNRAFGFTKNIAPRKGDLTYIKNGELTNQTVGQHLTKEILNNKVLQTTQGKLIGIQIKNTSNRISTQLQNKLLPYYQGLSKEDFQKTQSLINNAKNVTVQNDLIKNFKRRQSQRTKEYSSKFQNNYKKIFKSQIKRDISKNRNIEVNKNFWQKYNKSLSPVVNIPKISTAITEGAGALLSAPVATGLGLLGFVSGGNQVVKGIKKRSIGSVGIGLLEAGLSSLMIRSGLGSMRASAIEGNIKDLLNPNLKYSDVRTFETDKPNFYIVSKQTPLLNSNGGAVETTLMYVRKIGDKDFSIVGGVSEVKGATGFGKGKIEFGNKNLIKGISIGKEVKNPILRISNKEGLGEDNLKLSFSKIKSKPLLKYIKTGLRKGSINYKEYENKLNSEYKNRLNSFNGKYKFRGKNKLFFKGKSKSKDYADKFFEWQPTSASLSSNKISFSGTLESPSKIKRYFEYPKESLPNFKLNELSFLNEGKGRVKIPKNLFNSERLFNIPKKYTGNEKLKILRGEEVKKQFNKFLDKKEGSKVTKGEIKALNKVLGENVRLKQEMVGKTKENILNELRNIGVNVPFNFKGLLKTPSKVSTVGLVNPTLKAPLSFSQPLFNIPSMKSNLNFQSSFDLRNFQNEPVNTIPRVRSIFSSGGSSRLFREPRLKTRQIQKSPIQKKRTVTTLKRKTSQRNNQRSIFGSLGLGSVLRNRLAQSNINSQRFRQLTKTRTLQRTKMSPKTREATRSFSNPPINPLFNYHIPKIDFSFGGFKKSFGSSRSLKRIKKKREVSVKEAYQPSVGAIVLGLKTTKAGAKKLLRTYEGGRLRPEISLINRSQFNEMHPAFVKASPLIIDRLISEGNNMNAIMKLFTRYNTQILQNEQKVLLERKSLTVAQKKKKRSEEHTSELQSHSFISYAVFCLKKKKQKNISLIILEPF